MSRRPGPRRRVGSEVGKRPSGSVRSRVSAACPGHLSLPGGALPAQRVRQPLQPEPPPVDAVAPDLAVGDLHYLGDVDLLPRARANGYVARVLPEQRSEERRVGKEW